MMTLNTMSVLPPMVKGNYPTDPALSTGEIFAMAKGEATRNASSSLGTGLATHGFALDPTPRGI